ncbi:MAG: hypothetical protein ABI083_00550 [Lapillicoccus sp.]
MRRGNGIGVIAVAAALGVTAAVAIGTTDRGARAGAGSARTGKASTTDGTGGLPSTGTPPVTASRPDAPPPTTSGPAATPTGTFTLAELSGAALTPANLFRLDDLERAGWVTGTISVTTRPGDGPGLVGTCQAQPLSTLPGGGGAISASYLGRTTNAYESAASFTTPQAALAAYDRVVTWFRQCADGTLPGHLGRRTSIGPVMQVNLDTEYDRVLWVTVGGDGFDGTAGVAVVGRRVALFYDQDKDPATQTVNSLMTAVALRLTA